MIVFKDVDEAKKIIGEALSGDDWQKSFLLHQDGDIKNLYVDKNIAKSINDIAPFGSFDSEEQGMRCLHECLILKFDEIIHWLVEGNNLPLKLFFTFEEPIGYCFDSEGNEHKGEKVQLCLRRDRKNTTEFGMFVSHFHPIYEFIK